MMELQRVSVNGVKYGEGVTEAMKGKAVAKRAASGLGDEGEDTAEMQDAKIESAKREMLNVLRNAFTNRWAQTDKLTLISPQLARDLANPNAPQHPHVVAFFRALAVCHSVLPDRPQPTPKGTSDSTASGKKSKIGSGSKSGSMSRSASKNDLRSGSVNGSNAITAGSGNDFIVNYKAESPDEAALVAGARDVGFPFISTSTASVSIEVLGQPERFAPLKTLEFNSARKRMSVIVRDTSGRIILYTKGADSVVYARLRKLPERRENDNEDERREREVREKTAADMEDFANGGLRTLCIAHRQLTKEEYESWVERYDAATTSLVDREAKIDAAMDEIEVGLDVLGATALEDKLQEGVPQAIEILHQAGIKLWILTGDKVQTAIEIGYSCNLLKSGMDVMVLAATSKAEARQKVEEGLSKVVKIMGVGAEEKGSFLGSFGTKGEGKGGGFAVVIDGETLRYVLEEDLKSLFLNLAERCDTVVCCRVSPAQKALTVKLVRSLPPLQQYISDHRLIRIGQRRTQRNDSFHRRRR